MTNTLKTPVTPAEGWKLITTGSGGAFTASGPCYYYFGTDAPVEQLTGHRLDTGDIEKFILAESESMWVRSATSIAVIVSVTGVGYTEDFFRKMANAMRAYVVQPYIETNCKTGTQWGYSTYNPTLAKTPDAGSVNYLLVKTGAKPISLKSRSYIFDGLGIAVTVTRNPTLTIPGTKTNVTSLVYNFSDRNPATLLSQFFSVPSSDIVLPGDVWIPTRTFIGDSQQGSNVHTVVNADLTGLELWFNENTEYLIKTQSIDATSVQRLGQFATFYEGFPDLP